MASKRHKHQWRMVMHLDGCHWHQSSYRCECGAQYYAYIERNPTTDPYSMVWMDDIGGEPCERCEQLKRGEKPKAERVLVNRFGREFRKDLS